MKITYENRILDVEAEWVPEQKGDLETEPIPAHYELLQVLEDGEDIINQIDYNKILKLYEQAIIDDFDYHPDNVF